VPGTSVMREGAIVVTRKAACEYAHIPAATAS
jgi:hypothetical protein